MPKYKYVDGVKYQVVPNSALGYNLVPVDEGGGEGGGGEGDITTNETVLPLEVSKSDFTYTLDAPTWEVAKAKYSNGAFPIMYLTTEDGVTIMYPVFIDTGNTNDVYFMDIGHEYPNLTVNFDSEIVSGFAA